MLTFDDKGGRGGGQKTQKPAYVIHGSSPTMFKKGTRDNFPFY